MVEGGEKGERGGGGGGGQVESRTHSKPPSRSGRALEGVVEKCEFSHLLLVVKEHTGSTER